MRELEYDESQKRHYLKGLTGNSRSLKIETKDEKARRKEINCAICPPNKNENANRRDNDRKHSRHVERRHRKR